MRHKIDYDRAIDEIQVGEFDVYALIEEKEIFIPKKSKFPIMFNLRDIHKAKWYVEVE